MCVCLFVCWFVGLLFIGHTTFVHFAALPPSTPRAAKPSRAAPRARGQACTARARARACRTTSQRKNRCVDAFQKQNRTRAHAVVYVTAEIFKKREKKTNMPLPKFSLQFACSWNVYFSNRTESYLIFGRSRPWSARSTIQLNWSVQFVYGLWYETTRFKLQSCISFSLFASCMS